MYNQKCFVIDTSIPMNNILFPDRHKQRDFFTCDVFDTYKDDTASMEHPVFSLSTRPDFRVLIYEHNDAVIKIKPSYTGLATIHDKDILLYLASCLMNAKNNGEKINQVVRFIAYDYMISTNKKTSGIQYQQLKDGLSRLKGTVIQTNIKTNSMEVTREFSLIDEWGVIKEDHKGKMIAVEVKLSDWFYNSILGDAVLSIDRDYFRIRKPTERRLYELARKHCGNQSAWKIKLENLKTKLGVTSPIRTLRFNIKKTSETNHLPEYNISIKDDVVLFSRKTPPKNNNKSIDLPKVIGKKEIEKQARPGESYKDAMERITGMKKALSPK